MKCNVEQLWADHKLKLFAFISKRVNDPEQAADIFQDVLLKVYGYCEKKSDVRNIKAWLFQIAQNTIIDSYNKSNRFVALENDQIEGDSIDIDTNASIWIEPLLGFLPNKYAEALTLADLEGVPQKVVANILGLSLEATKSRIQRARNLLKVKFNDCGVIETNDNLSFSFTVTKPCCLHLEKKVQ